MKLPAPAGALAALLCAAAHAAAPPTPQPRVELGVGAVVLAVPDYRGSDRYDVQAYPIPYAAYRSERVQITREGLRARLFSLERLTASMSAALNLPGSRDNPDRAGMPQIDPTFEAGPSLDYRLAQSARDGRWRLGLRLPLRAAVAADGVHLKAIGWDATPHLRLDYAERIGAWERRYAAAAGAVFASEDYHEYFYGVAREYATPQRPFYDARAGYSGARASLSATLIRRAWRVGVFATYDWLDGAVFEDSPLVKADASVVAGAYITYRLYARGTGESIEEGGTP